MTIFFFPLDDESALVAPPPSQSVQEALISIQSAVKAAEAQERPAAAVRNHIVTFRIPLDLLARLDAIGAAGGAASRGHLLRQVIAEYVGYVDECKVRYGRAPLRAHFSQRVE